MKLLGASKDPGIRLLRISIAILLFIHGCSRIATGGVVPFGGFLRSVGIPFGDAVAWILTIVEIIGCPLLAAGLGVIPLSIWFIVELIAGIILVHAKEGWFVVGAGRNGVEFSVLLILGLASVITSEVWWRRRAVHRDEDADLLRG